MTDRPTPAPVPPPTPNALTTTPPDRTQLIADWEALKGSKPPPGLSSTRLHKDIRYTKQVASDPALQQLDREVRRRLKQLSRQTKPKKKAFPSGTRFLREWHGKNHEVTATDNGFYYQGETYRSLTAIARHITGTQWSGPNFFGVK